MITKRKPGRPPENMGRKVVSIVLSSASYAALEETATRDGYRVAQLARLLIERGLKGEGK